MSGELKFVEGGIYRTRCGTKYYQIKAINNSAHDTFVWYCGQNSWSATGKSRSDGKESQFDLVQRVNVPTDYVPVKKWLWETDVYEGDRFITSLRSTIHSESIPQPGENSLRNWRKVKGSEVEE